MSMRIACLAPVCFYYESEKLGSIESKEDQIVQKIEEIRLMVMEIMAKDKADPKLEYYASIQDQSQGISYTAIIHPKTEELESKCDHCDLVYEKSRVIELKFEQIFNGSSQTGDNDASSDEADTDSFEFPEEEISIAYTIGGLHRLTRHPETGPHKTKNTDFYSYFFPTGNPNP